MLRRGFLGMLAASPITLPTAATTAVSGAVAQGIPQGPSRIVRLFAGERRRREQWDSAQQADTVKYAHYSISTKKSWSPAFKAHCEGKRRQEQEDLWSFDTDEEMAAWLIKRGFRI